jgi:hypothetical protein
MSNQFSSVVNETGALLKRFYIDGMVDQLNNDMPVMSFIEKSKAGVAGDATYVALKLNRNQGIGAGTDGGNMPGIGRYKTSQAVVAHKYNWLRTGLTAGIIAASKNDKGAFLRQLDAVVKAGYVDLKSDLNRQLGFDGTGTLGKLSAAAVATQSISVQGREGTTEDGSKFIFPDMIIDIVSSAGVYKATGVTVTAVTGTTTATVTLDTPVTAASGDLIVRTGAYNAEIQGLGYALDGGTSTIYGIDRSAYPQFQGNLVNVSGGQLTIDAMQTAWNLGLRRGGTGNGSYQGLLMDFDSSRYYGKLLQADRRYISSGETMDNRQWKGAKSIGLSFNNVPIMVDKDLPQRIYMIPSDVLKLYVLNELEQATETGSGLIAQTDSDSFEIRMRFFANMFNSQPSACAALYNYISP